MGSSSQHYRGTARTFTEEWENVTEYTGVTASSYWKREHHRDWSSMVEELRWTWELHVYVTASLFSVLAVLCLFTVLRLRSQLSHSKNLTSINVFLGLLATSRLLVLYLDPYGSKLILPAVMLQVLWDLGYPCLVSAFCLLQLAVVRAEGAEKGAQRVTRLTESTASIVITFHFCLIITSGVLGAVQNWLRIVWIITQVVFIVWGGFLFLSTLLGCLRTLRSIVNLPIRLLAQVDPGCEVNSIVPLGMFTEEAPPEQTQRPQQNHHPHHPHHPPKSDHPPHQHHPGIHITDVDEQTYSYASNASLAAQQHQLHRSESMPMRCPPAMSPTHPLPDEQKRKQKMKASHLTSPNEDPASIKPLIVSSLPEIHVLQSCQDRPRRYTLADQKGRNQARGPATIFAFEPRSPKQSLSPSLMPSILAEDIKNETRHPCRSRFEKNLRHLVFTSCLGIALCLLRAYDVFGLDGLMACGNTGPVLQWFFFQTISRFVELCMAFSLVCGSQRCMNSRYYYYRN